MVVEMEVLLHHSPQLNPLVVVNHVVMAVTGELPPEERVGRISELQQVLADGKVPVLVATDCLSEGIDLQHTFDAGRLAQNALDLLPLTSVQRGRTNVLGARA